MSDLEYLDVVWAVQDDGVKVFPYKGLRGPKKGLYSVSLSGSSKKTVGMTEAELIKAIEGGKFKDRGLIRMLPKVVKGGEDRNGYSPTYYKGMLVKEMGAIVKHSVVYPDQIDPGAKTTEGARQRVEVNRFERSASARADCINHHGLACAVCCLNFETVYGDLGTGFIHVHHIVPLHAIGETYEVDPIKDLIPVCPNCHAMLHRKEPPYLVNELQDILKKV